MEVEGVSSTAIDLTPDKDGGVLKEILREGEGDEFPQSGDRVSVHYVGTLLEDGSQFDSSRDRGDMFEFTLGKGEVIKAWDLGVASMKKGELCKLICKSEYAYGEKGSPPKIPPNACLVFEVELFFWRGEDLSSKKDGGIIRRIVETGEGYSTPNDGALVDVSLVGRVDGTSFDDRSLKFNLGEGSEHDIPEGLERALERFKKNEKSIIKLTPKYTFGSGGRPSLGVPPGTNVEYEVHLKDFEKAKETWEMSQEEKLEQANLFKVRGTEYFKKEKYRLAVKQYKKVTDYVQYDSGLSDDQKKESHTMLLAGHLNLSMCHLKMKNYLSAREHATKAIEMDSSNVKAFFRRGQALVNLEEADLARADLEKCLSLDPTNKAASHQLQLCVGKVKQQKQKEKQLYGGMFEKFAKVDAKMAAANKSKNDVMSGDLGEWETDKVVGTETETETETGTGTGEGEEREGEGENSLGEEYDFKSIEDIQMI